MKRRALVILLLLAACERHDAQQRDAALKADLAQIRAALSRYKADTGRFPATLQELTPRYLKSIPVDPFTNAADWRVETEDTVTPSADFTTATTGTAGSSVIVDVHSAAPGSDRNGVPYANY